ncbi:hypothetical protein [Sphingomonas sp. TX0522]|uniref:hypothetical protein n=1 Tax=Sphingomonas sp. TX0522 TaxID=2479205 RepID=UPI001E572AAC|nr:hypothetical protein [Sphingomonas sp. TX0522]
MVVRPSDASTSCELTLPLQGVETFSSIDDLEAARLSNEKLQQGYLIDTLAPAVLGFCHPHQRRKTRGDALSGPASGTLLHQGDGAVGSIAPGHLCVLIDPDAAFSRPLCQRWSC